MKNKDLWFDFVTVLSFILMLFCAIITIARYFQDKSPDLLTLALTAAFFLLLALTYFRMSRQIGKYQEKSRQKTQIDVKLKEKPRNVQKH